MSTTAAQAQRTRTEAALPSSLPIADMLANATDQVLSTKLDCSQKFILAAGRQADCVEIDRCPRKDSIHLTSGGAAL